jgi:hypothetical protein
LTADEAEAVAILAGYDSPFDAFEIRLSRWAKVF